MKVKKYLKTSEIAHLAEVNTRTLHYYDEIGLFSPERKGDNGYRYYSFEQLDDLALILALKELDIPLKDIKRLLYSNVQTTKQAFEDKKAEIGDKIDNLRNIKRIIERKLHFLELSEKQTTEITVVDLEEEYLLISEKLGDYDVENVTETAFQLWQEAGRKSYMMSEFGTLVHHSKKDKTAHDYMYLNLENKCDGVYTKPSGKYLSYIVKGSYNDLNNAYLKIEHYIMDNNISVEGYFYERFLHDTTWDNQEENITEIQIKIAD